jgi:hypothetical protein
VQPWYDLAEKTLGPDDTIEKTYSCTFNKQNGYLCLGNNKLVFVNVKGFLRKNYEVLLDAPYNEVDEVNLASRFTIDLAHNNKRHQIVTSDIPARIVVEGIKDISKGFN